MLTLLLTLPGVAVTYNGDEIGMLDYREITWEDTLDPQACNTNDPLNYEWASRDPQRTPFQWDATDFAGFKTAAGSQPWVQVHPNYRNLNLEAQKVAEKSFYKFYQQLASIRNNEVFVNGDFASYVFNKEVLSYSRTAAGESFVVIINFGSFDHILNVNDMGVGFPVSAEVVSAGSKTSYDTG